jgi:hypothetical protein
MTYHHLNRFKAHNKAKLTTAERLLAWHFSYETRSNRSYYSESLRRLEETLDLNPKTIRRALSGLVDKGLFERIDKTGTHAPIYSLLVPCPFNCEDLENHNTKQELEAIKPLLLPNTPTLKGIQTPPYIEKREEEDISSVSEIVEGSAELIFILEALKTLPSLNEDQLTLKGFIELNPHAVAKAALEITSKAGLDTPKRVRTYLTKTAINSPQNLLAYAEATNASLEGTRRLTNATQPTPSTLDLEGLAPEATWERIKSFAAEALPSYAPTYLARNYLEKKAQKGELTDLEINLASMFEEVITKQAFPFMKEAVAKADDGSIYFDLDEDGVIQVKGFLQGWLQNANFIYTPEEATSLSKRLTLLAEARLFFMDTRRGEEFSIVEFSMLPEVRAIYDLYPDIDEHEKSRRFLDHFSNTLRSFAETYLENFKADKDFNSWLNANFTLEDDFKKWLNFFPEREKGSHAKHAKKAYPSYVSARRSFCAGDLISLAQRYWNTLTNLDYAKYPENFLLDLVAEPEKVAY